MELTDAQACLILNALPHIGPVNLRRLLAAFEDDPREVLSAGTKDLERVKGVGPAISGTIAAWEEHFDLGREEERIAKAKARFVTCRDETYPAMLREIYDPPIGLYQRGDYGFVRPMLAMVGSRKTTLYGQKVAKTLARELTEAGFCVVSGLARGIDTAAHEGALEAGGPTVGVLGTGMNIVYPPENLDLYRQVAANGAVVTEFPFDRRADRQSFAMRNRIVAGMSAGVIVIESDVAGGSMITARFAGEQGRQLFAVPGRIDQPTSAGCHQLIRDGAMLVTCVDDILAEFSYLDGLKPTPLAAKETADGGEESGPPMSASEDKVFACFAGGAQLSPDELTGLTGLGVSEVTTALMMLELQRRLARRTDGRYEAT
ncbi:DNA-processing protein DprA [Synoicihabitans lomoniglobus]|uniref:DNA-processing protein DprA n=1 Tax=Synoicihabitans lomoniglobus TaxID=2909285 RepID=A0AAF0CIQ1_9BACT|nr:DNA-processing protein DprA [Opitutaceae bacterium LMO-M01]WED65657.1 DNA-processing protein DprA [Opitutaceae bacterium LMO-M01]